MLNEVEIRRLYISDESWERTSKSWKELKPFRNFNQAKASDESAEECFERLRPKYKIPFEVIDQWIYPLYYNENTVKNYSWIDYLDSEFKKVELTTEQVSRLYVVKLFLPFVREKQKNIPFSGFSCLREDIKHWKQESTWRIPPVVLDVNSFSRIPEYAEIVAPYQLIEGHSRLSYLLAMQRAGILEKSEHQVYLLSKKREETGYQKPKEKG